MEATSSWTVTARPGGAPTALRLAPPLLEIGGAAHALADVVVAAAPRGGLALEAPAAVNERLS